jgi:hypothetical protein
MYANTQNDSGLPVRAIVIYLSFLLLVVLLQISWEHAGSQKDFDLLNFIVPISFGAANLLLAFAIIRKSPLAIWNPLFWLLIACTIYYGLGQLIHLLGHPDSAARVNSLYFVDSAGLARTNFLNTVGVTIIVGSYLMASNLLGRSKRAVDQQVGSMANDQRSTSEARSAAILFLCIGVPVKYFLELPHNLGLLTWVLPGSIQYLGTLSGVAIIPLYWLYKKRGGIYRPLFFALIASESLASLTSLSKQKMIETLLFLVLGSQLVKPGLKKLAVSGILMAAVFVLILNPFVTFARVTINRSAAKDLSQAFDLVEQFRAKKGTVQDVQFPNEQMWWTRLAYSNVELFAMREYDRGHAGATFWLAPYTLVPRFIMEDKPGMTSGFDFTQIITGSKTLYVLIGIGALGEGYWNGGWLGVAVVGFLIGVLLAAFYQFSVRTLGAGVFMFLPMSMAGIIMGLRIDDWFVPTYLGMPVQLLLMYLAIQYGIRPLLGRNSPTAIQPVTEHIQLPEKSSRQFPLLSG